MRKSLGQKRNEISDTQIEEITRVYGAFKEGPNSKIFTNEEFGFLSITIERPLQLRWEVTDETIATFKASKTYVEICKNGLENFSPPEVAEAFDLITTKLSGRTFASDSDLAKALALTTLKIKPKDINKLIKCFAVHDPKVAVVVDRNGNPKPDSNLRDTENPPLPPTPVSYETDPTARLNNIEYRATIDDYLETEIFPYVPDAWCDYSKTKIGYEIPLTRHFYIQVPARPLKEIDADIRALETEIQNLLTEAIK